MGEWFRKGVCARLVVVACAETARCAGYKRLWKVSTNRMDGFQAVAKL